METENAKTEVPAADPNTASNEKGKPSHEEQAYEGRPIDPPDIESARPDVEQHPPMTFKRFMAIFSLGCLLAAAQIPLYLIGGSLCITISKRD
jgi:hypothetical protein